VSPGTTTFERVGGTSFFETLTQTFYESVRTDPVLRPLYPADERRFEAARGHLELFLVQHFGGPPSYRAERGEAQLGRRHRRFAIGPEERDAWIRHMSAAVRAAGLGPLEEMQMLSFFTATADSLVNRP
jgi:hemoglobin